MAIIAVARSLARVDPNQCRQEAGAQKQAALPERVETYLLRGRACERVIDALNT